LWYYSSLSNPIGLLLGPFSAEGAVEAMSAIRQKWPLVVGGAAALIGLLIFGIRLRCWESLPWKVDVTQLAGLLAPVVFAAAVVERSVEILVSPWRDTGASKLQKELSALQTLPADQRKPADEKIISDKLDEYRGVTQQYAFAVSLVLSMCVSIAGVRALGPFLVSDKFSALRMTRPGQYYFFLAVDVALSATLLAGGADGVHSVVNAVTSFFDASADKAAKQTSQ
jgi:hypothetical protein